MNERDYSPGGDGRVLFAMQNGFSKWPPVVRAPEEIQFTGRNNRWGDPHNRDHNIYYNTVTREIVGYN